MDVRRFVRGTVPWDQLELIVNVFRQRYERTTVRVEFLDANNWLSTPCVVDEEYFLKIISPQNALVHAIFTGARNLGAVTTGSSGFFEGFDGPYEMAEHELEATRRLRSIGVAAPRPRETFQVGEFGVLVLEYLPEFTTLAAAETDEFERTAGELVANLARMHDHNLAHGDLRAENVLLYDGTLYFIDVTKVRDASLKEAAAYDLACALAIMASRLESDTAVRVALEHYDITALLRARDFLHMIGLRPDHDFDVATVKGEIEKRASQAAR